MNAPTRPILRYHGGKWMLAPWIIAHMPPHRVYVEPYGGAGSVLLRKPRAYAEVYNDLFTDVVTAFRIVQDPASAEALRHKVYFTPYAREEFNLAYTETDDPIEQTRRMIIRSHMGFGNTGVTQKARTGFRANSNRSGSTPAHDWMTYPDAIPRFTERLRGVVIESRPALKVMKAHDSVDTLHYVDPPYVHVTRGYNKRYAWEMTDDDHRELAATLQRLRGMVLVSGYRSDLYDELFDGWYSVERKALADGALERTEVLWMNEACRERLTLDATPQLFAVDGGAA